MLTKIFPSYPYALGTGIVLAVLAAAPFQAMAHDADHDAKPTAPGSAAVANMTVVRDAETGKLRAPTADEISALQAKEARVSSLRAAPATTLQKYHFTGARGVRLTEEFISHSVAVRNADGTLSTQCLDSAQAVDDAMKRAAPVSKTLAAKLETE